ncbi:MAG: NAD-dependent epimerase/dehydratase family protein, partial [Chloroflexi bacterium]|nr:NAD-dependent epimerase/dehydratase family protein [Chloroflexota bacterium]
MKALVIGGTGPSGPHIVNGLIERGYDVVVLHGGQHEAEFAQPVEHVHADPHFAEILGQALTGRAFDLTVATYGRVRIIADVIKGKTQRLITVGGGGVYAQRSDPRWGPLGAPTMVPEDSPLSDDPNGPRLAYLMWVTEQAVMQAHRDGHYSATIFRYPQVYGPNAPANPEWSIVRRVLDRRKHIIVASGGASRRRAFGQNAAHALLLAVDKPIESGGQVYNIREEVQHSQRQQVEFIAKLLDHEWEVVEVPSALANKVYRGGGAQSGGDRFDFDITKVRTQLGYRDVVAVSEALARSARWLVANRPEPGGEIERQLGDPFAYEAEDALIHAYGEGVAQAEKILFPEVHSGHMYRHPTRPGEAWAPPPAR